MSNKTLIPVIIILSLITIGVASLTQLNKASGKVVMNSSSEVVSSVKSQVVSSSSSVLSQVSSSDVFSSQKVAESVKAESKVAVPQYVKDYLNCPTKFTAVDKFYFRLGIYKDIGDTEYKYLCVPQNVVDECSKLPGGMAYGFKYNKGYKLESLSEGIKKYGRDAIIEEGKYYCNQYTEGWTIFSDGYPVDRCPESIQNNSLIVSRNDFNNYSNDDLAGMSWIDCYPISLNLFTEQERKVIVEKLKY
jgi:hypothetical protein